MKSLLLCGASKLVVRQALLSVSLSGALALTGCDKTDPGSQDLSTPVDLADGTNTPDMTNGGGADMTGNPPDMTGNPPDMTGNPPDMTGNPPDMAGNPPDMAGNPPDMAGNPPDMAGNPPDMAGNPPDMAGNPPDMAGNPPDMAGPRDMASGGMDGGVMPDGGAMPDMVSPPADMASPPPLINGTIATTFVTDTGDVVVPANLVGAAISALIPSGMGSYVTVNGTGTANGTFTIPGVPLGTTYYLKVGTTYYLVTDARTLDLGSDVLGRQDVAEAMTSPTNLTIAATGLSPWKMGYFMELFASNAANYVGDVLGEAGVMPAANATSVNATIDWTQLANPSLIDGNKNDRAYLAQYTFVQSANMFFYFPLTVASLLPAFAQVDGMATSVSGALTAPMAQSTVSVAWKRAQFDAQRIAVNPNATATPQIIFFLAQPGGLAKGPFSDTADLLAFQPDTNATDIDSGTMTYRNPYPVAWAPIGYAGANFTVDYTVPNNAKLTVGGGMTYQASQSDFTNGLVRPLVTPPRVPLINGMDAFANRVGVGTTPTLSWTAPAFGAPSGYQVRLLQLAAQGGQTVASGVATFMTKGTQLVVPPGVLTAGKTYFFQVTARQETGVELVAKPFRRAFPSGTGDLFTGTIAP